MGRYPPRRQPSLRSKSLERCAIAERFRSDSPLLSLNERKTEMAAKTKAIEVKVDERLAETLNNKAVKAWHATNYSNGRKRVYVTFEELKAM